MLHEKKLSLIKKTNLNPDIAIKVENVSKVFPLRFPRKDEKGNDVSEHWALKNVSFEIKKGESVGIIGPNGSGKSTLLQILAGITKPTSGNILIQGKVASILEIGAGFNLDLSGRDNVFLNGQIHGFSKKEIEEKYDEIIEFSGIKDFIDEPVKNYSNGMYLRLAFSIMVQLKFDVYLLDEVMSVGDEGFKEKVQSFILNSLINDEITLLLVSHNFNEIDSYCERAIMIQDGQLKKEGTGIEIIRSLKQSFDEKRMEKLSHLHDYLDDLKISMFVNNNEEVKAYQDDEINIKVKLKKNKPIPLRFSLRIRDTLGSVVFITTYPNALNQKILQNNHIELQVQIPSNYFNQGYFTCDLLGTDEAIKKIVFLELSVFHFAISFRNIKDAFWLEKMSGPVHPKLKWSIIET